MLEHLYRLHPLKTTYMIGFGKAFVIEGKELNHVRDLNAVGHRAEREDVVERMDRLQAQDDPAA